MTEVLASVAGAVVSGLLLALAGYLRQTRNDITGRIADMRSDLRDDLSNINDRITRIEAWQQFHLEVTHRRDANGSQRYGT